MGICAGNWGSTATVVAELGYLGGSKSQTACAAR
jgi:hypothetical protein